MRRKIKLYIANSQVDLDDQSFILFNYTMDDLSNPTIVKNSFSQQITLKGTPANNRIFGDYFRADREIGGTGGQTGVDFNASRKTPFTIYNEMGEILESGYVKLDSIDRNGADVQYKVTLYGGLGSFFYALSYDQNGNKRSLADLVYLDHNNPDTELDFIINASAVQAAWARLFGDTSASPKWDVINFAPAYNGIPDGNFAPDKGLVNPTDVGLQDTIDGHTTKNGYCLVNLAEAQDEWAVKDLRSYLQRPVLSMKAFWTAICDPLNNGGYEVDASVVQDYDRFGRYSELWKTLPLIPSIGTISQRSGDLSVTMSTNPTTGTAIGGWTISGQVTSGTKVTANLHCRVRFNMPSGADAYSTLRWMVTENDEGVEVSRFTGMFLQVVAYASDNSVVGGSKIKVVGVGDSGEDIAAMCGYIPAWAADYESLEISTFRKISSGVFGIYQELGFQVEAQDVAYYKLMVTSYYGQRSVFKSGVVNVYYSGTGYNSTLQMYADASTSFESASAFIAAGTTADTITYTTADTLRSGAAITKKMLLSSSHTPAEYMLSFCKIFGLGFTYDNATKKVTIYKRTDLYQDETIDLTRRVDKSRGVNIKPLVYQAKWYDFILDGVGGAFYDEYLKVEGMPYGIQRVNTGYDFNADSVNLMDSVVFKNACTILARSKYFNYIFEGAAFKPSPFVDKGNTYTLWSVDGDTLDTDISCPSNSAITTYYNDNPALPGYDINTARKLELRDADNKPVKDGSDVLVFHEGWNGYPYFKLTDDVPAMDLINDGVPCWLLGAGAGTDNPLRIPIFQRYNYGAETMIEDSLDFGTPKQLDIPKVRFMDGCNIYERYWKAYLADRYNANTKVMTCRVNFEGIQVNQELLRKFYWYDNSLWVLNAIRNYSLTTFDPMECEFVQVQDKAAYIGSNSHYLRAEPRSFILASGATSQIVAITSDVAWNISTPSSWVTLSASSGSGNANVTLNISANTSSSARSATITLSSPVAGVPSVTIYVSQQGASVQHYLTLSQNSFTLNRDAASLSVMLRSDIAWEVSNNSHAWVSVSPISGNGDATIAIQVSQNTGSSERVASLVFSPRQAGQVSPVTLAITQSAYAPGGQVYLRDPDKAGKENWIVLPAVVYGFNVGVYATGNYTIVCNDSWIKIGGSSTYHGQATPSEGSLWVSVEDNTTGAQRIGTMTITLDSDPSVRMDFTITQNA